MSDNYFMGLDGFVWFTGVVESRNDPAELGRVQVRCLGYHTEDLIDIPTEDLPWAHIMMPVTDPSMQGLGNSPSFLVEGTWVVGFFRDANEKQQPIIMGSLPGVPGSTADVTKGFNDPTGQYPSADIDHSGHGLNESDVSRLARGQTAETHELLINRRGTQWKGIPTATKPNVSSVSSASETETAATFDEPNPRNVERTGGSTGAYPFNHVYESESGHVFEIDDTTGGERLLRQHTSGTYEEIVDTGTKTVKVVGDNYELIAGKSNIYVKGDINLTCSGNKREKIDGDYILEVGGNFTRKIHKSEQVKIGAGDAGGNLEEEIIGNHGFNISNSVSGAIGTTESGTAKDCDISIGGNETRTVGGAYSLTSVSDMTLLSNLDLSLIAQQNLGTLSLGKTSMTSGNSLALKSAETMNIKSDTSVALESISTMDIVGGTISTLTFATSGSTVTAETIELTTHTHTDTEGLSANITSAPNA